MAAGFVQSHRVQRFYVNDQWEPALPVLFTTLRTRRETPVPIRVEKEIVATPVLAKFLHPLSTQILSQW
jgi:hypothetical protein